MHAYTGKYLVGTGAAIDVALGFIPDWVKVVNVSDRDVIHEGPLNPILAFDGGGGDGLELKPGDRIQGATSKATAIVRDVLVADGTWAGGDAEGFLVLSLEEKVEGTFADNDDIAVATQKGSAYGVDVYEGNYATVNGAARATGMEIGPVASAKAVNAGGANDTIAPYFGATANAALGITLGSTISESDKLLHVAAWREGVG